jgi:hypothetical protein
MNTNKRPTVILLVVPNGKGLHDTDRETYMEDYHLRPDELIAKEERRCVALCPPVLSPRLTLLSFPPFSCSYIAT